RRSRPVPLSEDDVREILRLIDESDVEELRIETGELSLHVLRGDAGPAEIEPAGPPRSVEEDGDADGLVTIEAPTLGTFYRAAAPGARPFVDVGTEGEPDPTVRLREVRDGRAPGPADAG